MTTVTNGCNGTPPWLNGDYFREHILAKKSSGNGDLKVNSFDIGPANQKGENYASVMFRAKMKVEQSDADGKTPSERSFIVKINPDTGKSKEMMELFNVFPKEMEMYDKIIPAFEEMYRSVGESIQFGPK